MDIQKKYDTAAWERIGRLPYMVAIGMEGAGRSGLSGSAQERHATVLSILSAREAFAGNPLIEALLPEGEDPQCEQEVMRRHDAVLDFLDQSGIQSSNALWDHIETCATGVLQEISGHEAGDTAEEFARWLLRIASDVSVAAKEGDFLGLGGARISAEEKSGYDRLERALQPYLS